jgi:hypothetical protein
MNSSEHLSKKDLTRKFRHEAYLRAKKFKKTDPRQIALKEAQKEFQREAYQEAKKRNKVYRDAIKKAGDERAGKKKAVRQNKLKALVMRGSSVQKKVEVLKS